MTKTASTPGQARAAIDARRVLDAVAAPILAVNPGLQIVYANMAAANDLAAAAGGLLGRRLGDVFGRQSALIEIAASAARGAVLVQEHDVMLDGPGFSLGRYDVTASSGDEDSLIVLTFGRKSQARSSLEAPRVSPMARALAHEIRNPLAGIRAAAQLMAKGGEIHSLSQLICTEVDRVRRLTDRLDAMESMTPARLAVMNVHEVLVHVRAVAQSSFPGTRFDESYDPSLPLIMGDFDLLVQAFLNIAKNAAEAAQASAEPRVVLATRFRPGLRVRQAQAGARARLEVSIEDNGAGISANIAGRLFEPFATTKQSGVGLGLAIAADIVTRHDGRIDVETAPGRTLFKVLLPMPRGEEA
jgi:two-component system nitrogen regulation sensor histidine kinase GlnL